MGYEQDRCWLLWLEPRTRAAGPCNCMQCMGGCHHGGRWCGDTPLRTLGANARDAGYDSEGDALRRLAGCAPILRGSGSAAEGTLGQLERCSSKRESVAQTDHGERSPRQSLTGMFIWHV